MALPWREVKVEIEAGYRSKSTDTDLTLSPNPFRAKAYEELSKHYEHREREHLKALECTRAARAIADSDPLVARQRPLEAKCAKRSLAFDG